MELRLLCIKPSVEYLLSHIAGLPQDFGNSSELAMKSCTNPVICTWFYCAFLWSYHQYTVNSHDIFTQILHGYFTGTGAIDYMIAPVSGKS